MPACNECNETKPARGISLAPRGKTKSLLSGWRSGELRSSSSGSSCGPKLSQSHSDQRCGQHRERHRREMFVTRLRGLGRWLGVGVLFDRGMMWGRGDRRLLVMQLRSMHCGHSLRSKIDLSAKELFDRLPPNKLHSHRPQEGWSDQRSPPQRHPLGTGLLRDSVGLLLSRPVEQVYLQQQQQQHPL